MKLCIVRCNITNLYRIFLFKKAFLYTSEAIGFFFVVFVYCLTASWIYTTILSSAGCCHLPIRE